MQVNLKIQKNRIISANCVCGVDCKCSPCYCNPQEQVKALDSCVCDPCLCGPNCQCALDKKVIAQMSLGCHCGNFCACPDC